MKAGYSSFFIIALLVYAFTTNHKDRNSDQNAGDNACASAIEQYQDALFPRNKWIESEAWILATFQMLGINADGMEYTVSNYEGGRATAMQLAISQVHSSPECIDKSNDD